MTQAGSPHPRDVLLVGSVPLGTTEKVFDVVTESVGPYLRRMPDGETGKRAYWITSQAYVLAKHPLFMPAGHDWDPESGTVPETGAPKYHVRPGVAAADIAIPRFGYADAARESYALFKQWKAAGKIDRRTRFQVSLPTPIAFIVGLVDPASQAIAAPAFERRIAEELEEVLRAIPHADLAIQWDVCVEIFIWEGIRTPYFADARGGCIDRLIEVGNMVPPDVELGYHLCYGDFRHKHSVEPKDTAIMVEMTNRVVAGLKRPPTWFHLPVPRERNDDAYFRPLQDLKLPAETELYLGLVHFTDGAPGALDRMHAASKYVGRFGLSTECGLGRRPPETIPALLRIHADLAARDT
ncbi:MAG: hypothetical protein AB7G15_07230 [Alphaproteobacteria bacterium]